MDRSGSRGREGLVGITTKNSVGEETLKDASDYRTLVSQSPLATAFHRPEWLALVEQVTGESVRLLRVLHGEETTAILPHVHSRWGPFRVLLSPPSRLGMQYLGPLIPDWSDLKQGKREERLNALAAAVLDHMRKTRVRSCRIRCTPELNDARAFQWSGFEAVPRYTYRVPVRDENAIWESMQRNVRSDIRRHEGALEVVPAMSHDWDAFENQLEDRYSQQGLRTPLPKGYLTLLRAALGPDLVLLVGKWAGRPRAWGEVLTALRAQNVQVSAGVLNQPPIASRLSERCRTSGPKSSWYVLSGITTKLSCGIPNTVPLTASTPTTR